MYISLAVQTVLLNRLFTKMFVQGVEHIYCQHPSLLIFPQNVFFSMCFDPHYYDIIFTDCFFLINLCISASIKLV